jgi:hypothetical protein
MNTIPLAASFTDPKTFDALLAGFAAFGSIVTFYSAYAAFLSWTRGDSWGDTADAAGVGLAYGFWIGVYVAALAVADFLVKGP